ncbi:sensor histidine kinase [Methanocella sp. MCL-LM]|uniref:sensor histidine kinase n=1 Tax=Methanocella sp. MCL-LM TaxID=3412035 RepID=UPI003C78B415
MLTRATRVKGFNLIQLLLIALWIAVLVYFISTLMVDFLHGTFTMMTAMASAIFFFVCLPMSIVIHRSNTDTGFKGLTLGLVGFIIIIVVSGILLYVLPFTFDWPWLTPAGQLLWFGAYVTLIIPLYYRLRQQRKKLAGKIDVILSIVCITAALLIGYSIVAQHQSLALNGFNIMVFAGYVIFDILLLTILSKLMLINMPNLYRYFFGILFVFFLLNFLSDILNFYAFLTFKVAVDINYSTPLSMVVFALAEFFISVALLLYSSVDISPVTVEEVKETLQDTQRLMNDVIAQSPDAICISDIEGTAVIVNDAFVKFFGVSRQDVTGKANIFDDTLRLNVPGYELARLHQGETVAIPVVKSHDGKLYLSVKLYPTYLSSGTISGYVVSAEDITERTIAEQQIKASLEEKKILLKEIHHRVKNNLQIVSSLLNIQASYVTDQIALDCFKESQQRVKSMALIHEKLYQSEDLSRVNFSEYISNLSTYLFRSYNVCPDTVSLDIRVEKITMDIDMAIPCGLIVNELVSNSLKHAFPDGRKGEVSITLTRTGDRYILAVGDNGIGFPPEIDFRNTGSLGMQLVSTLVTQLEGTIELDSTMGTKFIISFAGLRDNSGPADSNRY